MSAWVFLLISISETSNIFGQIFFKLAMGRHWENCRFRAYMWLGAGVAAMALGFFVWLGLLSSFELSFLYPFEGLSRVVLLVVAAVCLKEKITPSLCLGVLLISAGIVLVASS